MLGLIACISPWVIDGDSIRCANLGDVRLLGIDAPDYRSSRPCREHFGDHRCDDRGARAAKQARIGAKRLTPWTVEPITRDRYGRVVGIVRAAGKNLSCWQLQRGVVRYIVAYDNGRRIASDCR